MCYISMLVCFFYLKFFFNLLILEREGGHGVEGQRES